MSIDLQIRPGDCDGFAHVNNAAYVSYLQFALAKELARLGLAADWTREGDHYWEPKTLQIEYRQACTLCDHLTAQLWLAEPDRTQPTFGFEIKRSSTTTGTGSQQTVVRTRSAWQRVIRKTSSPVRLPADLLAGLPAVTGTPPRRFSLPSDSQQSKRYYWEHTVMRAEVGPSGRAHPQAIYHWLEESVFDATAQSGWTPERRFAAGLLVFQSRHDTEFFALPRAGDSVRVSSRVVDVRRLRGTWLQEVHKLPEGQLLVRDYSTGVFVDLNGRPTAPPREIMEQIQYGGP